MMLSRVGGTGKMLRGVDLLAASEPQRLQAVPETSRKVCAASACNRLLHRRCNEEPCTWNASQGFTFTEARKCTHVHPARGHSASRSTNRRDHQRET